MYNSLTQEVKNQTHKSLACIQQYNESLTEYYHQMKETLTKKYIEKIQDILKQANGTNPGIILQCMVQQQKEQLALKSQITASQNTCIKLTESLVSEIKDKYETIDSYNNQIVKQFLVLTSYCTNLEPCKERLKNETFKVANLKFEQDAMFKEIDPFIENMKVETDRCNNGLEDVVFMYLEEYIINFKKCVTNRN